MAAISDTIVHLVLIIVTVFFIGFAVIVWLWRSKSEEDGEAYEEVLKEKQVQTFYTPEEYAEASRRRKDQKRK